MSPQLPVTNYQPPHSPSCLVCEWALGVRGECSGTEDRKPCPAFRMATNRQGSVDLETGDEKTVESCELRVVSGRLAPMAAPLPPHNSQLTTQNSPRTGPDNASTPPGRGALSRVGSVGSGPQALSSPPPLGGAAAGLVRREAMADRARRGCGPEPDGLGIGLLSLWLVLGAACAVLGAAALRPTTYDLRPSSPPHGGDLVSASALGLIGRTPAAGLVVSPTPLSQAPASLTDRVHQARRNGSGGTLGMDARTAPPEDPAGAASRGQGPAGGNSPALARLLDAIRVEETGGGPAANAIGDRRSRWGPSRGPYQIGWAYWADARTGMPYAKVSDAEACRRVIVAYWRRYCPRAEEDAERGDAETRRKAMMVLARYHNGGPGNWKTNKAAAYARRVVARMKAVAV